MNIEQIMNAAKNHTNNDEIKSRIYDIDFVSGYSEQGYEMDGNKLIALGNWNNIGDDDTMERLGRLLEHNGVILEWEDEWMFCEDCGNIIRTTSHGYGWQPSYVINDGSVICLNCINPVEHLQELEGNGSKANSINTIDPSEYNYKKVAEELERGLHSHQNADPELIAQQLLENGISRFIFNIDVVDPFSIEFSLYVHDEEYYDNIMDDIEINGSSPSQNVQNALRNLSVPQAEYGKVSIVSVDTNTGETNVKNITNQEFIDGVS